MSRAFTEAPEVYVASVSSPANLTAFTFAAWVKFTSFGANGGTIFVKDPAGAYLGLMEILSDGTLFGEFGGLDLGGIGPSRAIANPGTGYAVGDTGFITGSNPDIAANRATYHVNSVDGSGAVTGFGTPTAGTGYAAGNTYPTARGGAQPGIGTGLTFSNPDLLNQANAFSQSNETIPLNTWTHVAMTWDSAGDGLVHLYINGVECTYQGTRALSTVLDASTGPYYFGDDSFDFAMTGSMAEVAIYSTALTAGQVAALAASTTGATGSPHDYWHLCGAASPEPNATNALNVGNLSTPAPARGLNSPGYTGCPAAPAGGGGTGGGIAEDGLVALDSMGADGLRSTLVPGMGG